MAIVNYEGKQVPDDQITAFRNALESVWLESLGRTGGVREWNENLLAITEKRRTLKNSDGTTKVFYSWCGDWVTYHLQEAGCGHKRALNREKLNGDWVPQMNLSWLRAWAGEPAIPASLRNRFANDPSSAAGGATTSFHAWDNTNDVCEDGYEPQLGDLVLCPRKNGDHIEFFVKRSGNLVTVSAGAQLGGTAMIKQRNLDVSQFIGIIDISGLATSEPF